MKRIALATFLLFSALALGGCFNAEADDQAVPWGRPASWENSAPGMGGF
jgi:hypothetical protein